MGKKTSLFFALLLSAAIAPHLSVAEDNAATRIENIGVASSASSRTGYVPQEIRRLKVNKYINAVAWNADGSRLAALSGFGGDITVWETKNWTVLKEFHNHGAAYAFNSLAFLPDGSLLTTPTLGPSPDPKFKTLSIFSLVQWNPDTANPVRYFPDLGDPPKEMPSKIIGPTDTFTVSKDGSLIAGIGGKWVLLYDAHTGQLARILEIPPLSTHPDFTQSVAFSPDGKTLAVGTGFGMVHFFNAQDGSLLRSFMVYPNEHYRCSALVYSPDGKLIAVGKHKNLNLRDSDDIAVNIVRTSDGVMTASLPGSTVELQGIKEADPVRTLSWGPKGNILSVGDGNNILDSSE